MAGVGTLVSSLLFMASKLLPEVKNLVFAPSSSSSAQPPNVSDVGDGLNELMRMLNEIKKVLYDAEERQIRDDSAVRLWLREIEEVGHDAEFVLDEYMYEVHRALVEARNASFELKPRKRKLDEGSDMASCAYFVTVPDGFVDRIREIRSSFDEIEKDRKSFGLREEDGPRCHKDVRSRAPTTHVILESNVYGRDKDKEDVIDLLFSNIDEEVVKVVPIVGKGGLGKTTLAQLVCNDKRVKQNFDLFGWVCVSEVFDVERLMRELVESLTRNSCSLKDQGPLQEKLKEEVVGKNVLVVLDDVWNEDENLWNILRTSFMSALGAFFMVTTRSDRVAKIMQTTPPFRLECLTEKDSWSLFQHYAFGGADHNVHSKFLDLGKRITEKCDGLPLALKSISSLLRHSVEDEETWVDILENDLWEIYVGNEIYGALQISYSHMPIYLRPCYLYCSLFPKNYEYDIDELIELWIADGYIQSEGRQNLEEIASEYALELRERSFFDPVYNFFDKEERNKFKMHDMVHDLARLNSGNQFYFKERGVQPNLPNEAQHIYLRDSDESWNHMNLNNITKTRTLLLTVKSEPNCIDLSRAKALRALKLQINDFWRNNFSPNFSFPKHLRFLEIDCDFCGSLAIPSSLYHLEKLTLKLEKSSLIRLEALGDLINLQSLSLFKCNIERFPESLGFLCNLRMLCIKHCTINEFPEIIGNLVKLQQLVVHDCEELCSLPQSLCNLSDLTTLSLTVCPKITELPNIGNLTNLQTLIITNASVNYVPPSFNKLNVLNKLNVEISLRLDGTVNTISWLNDFDNLKGTLAILQLRLMPGIKDACNFNLIRKPHIEKLILSWDGISLWDIKDMLEIQIETDEDYMNETITTRELLGEDMDLRVLENLKPHPNLKHLEINLYNNPVFPGWMGDPLSCACLEELHIIDCSKITYLPFGNLGSLKHLRIKFCSDLQTITRENLPLQLQSIIVRDCGSLLSITELEYLESLVEVEIENCKMLEYFSFELISQEHFYKSTGLNNLSPLTKLKIKGCPRLQIVVNEVVPLEQCNIEILNCTELEEWCSQHNISYKSDWEDHSYVHEPYPLEITEEHNWGNSFAEDFDNSEDKSNLSCWETTNDTIVQGSWEAMDQQGNSSANVDLTNGDMAKGNSSMYLMDED